MQKLLVPLIKLIPPNCGEPLDTKQESKNTLCLMVNVIAMLPYQWDSRRHKRSVFCNVSVVILDLNFCLLTLDFSVCTEGSKICTHANVVESLIHNYIHQKSICTVLLFPWIRCETTGGICVSFMVEYEIAFAGQFTSAYQREMGQNVMLNLLFLSSLWKWPLQNDSSGDISWRRSHSFLWKTMATDILFFYNSMHR